MSLLQIQLLILLPVLLVFLYMLRIEVAWRAIVKRRVRIEREYYRKVCLGDADAVAWANEQNEAMPSFDRMIFSLNKWKYEQFFKGELK